MPSAVLIVNPNASGVTPDLTVEVEESLRAAGELETVLTERPGHAAEIAEAVSRGEAERVYVFSGDGGFNEVVNGLEADLPVGFIPGGSTSVFPRALGLPRDPVAAARALATSAAERRISLGRVNGRRFTFSGGFGIDAEVVRRVDALGRAGGKRANDLAFARTLAGIFAERRACFAPAMEVEGLGRVAFALVANGHPYSYVGRIPLRIAPKAQFELGLDLVAPRELKARRLPQVAAWALAGKGQQRSPHVLYVHDADELVVRADRPMPLQVDGEDLGDVKEAHFEAERSALRVLVPE
ncbi:MAG TPA: diacylglycerol kinase family protein [Gaiellaceae bacterium]|nr:diacylglycerol kinase family protein [Gaiellaceae bacterium]